MMKTFLAILLCSTAAFADSYRVMTLSDASESCATNLTTNLFKAPLTGMVSDMIVPRDGNVFTIFYTMPDAYTDEQRQAVRDEIRAVLIATCGKEWDADSFQYSFPGVGIR